MTYNGFSVEIAAIVNGVKKADFVSYERLRSLSEGGDPMAMLALAILHDEPKSPNVDLNFPLARHWYEKAAERGIDHAQLALGNMYDYGQGGEQNDEQALRYYLMSAEQGNPEAQMSAARMYQTGRGTEAALDKAVFWYKEAIDRGHELAATNLGLIIMDTAGEDNEEAYKTAFSLFSFAADKLDGLAHYLLGEMHRKGQGVEQHVALALLHYFISEALLPAGENHDRATIIKEHILNQTGAVREKFEQEMMEYLRIKGANIPH
jgi:uncharacterized protein